MKKITENNHEKRKFSHLKCTGVRKKENDFKKGALEGGEKLWLKGVIFKNWLLSNTDGGVCCPGEGYTSLFPYLCGE